MANPYEYIVFEPDQVLTNDHLNETFNYLDQQNRWTRNKLIGIGIVCGLEIVQHTGLIEITKGCGVTSQGYLILQDTASYAYYIPYAAPDQPTDLPFTYTGDLPFYKPFCLNKTIYLLLTDEEYNALTSDEQKDALTLSSSPATFLNDFVVVLFLEAKELDLKNCTTFDCNNKGEKMMFAVRPLLVAKKDLPGATQTGIRGSTGGGAEINITQEIALKRFNVPYADLKTTDDVINGFTKIVDDATLFAVAKAYGDTYVKYKQILNISANPFTNLYKQLKDQREFILKNVPIFIQYFYDFIDDLIKAYYEFIVRVCDVVSECCPDENLFPLHLVLGEASKSTSANVHDPYRQYFIYSPLFSGNCCETVDVVFLFQRMQIMVKEFTVPKPSTFGNTLIKITPSQYQYALLSDRAIPYYYIVNESGNELYKSWSYFKTSHYNAEFNLGYNADQYSSTDAVIHPLLYDIEPYNFFRIEGHIGRHFRVALSNILQQRQQYNLPFDVVAVSTDQLPATADLPDCNIADLDTDYKLIVSELACKVHTPFCFYTKIPFKSAQFQTIDTPIGATPVTLKFSTFKAEALKQFAGALVFQTPGYVKGDFMRKYCPPIANTLGKTYLSALDSKGVFKNPVEVDQQNPQTLLHHYALEFIDAVEELMKPLLTKTISTLDMDVLQAAYQKYIQSTSILSGIVFIVIQKSGTENTQFVTFLQDWELDLVVEEFGILTSACVDDRLETLKDEYNSRLQTYLSQLLFLNYFKNHPGLEHKAGVPKGGTFVLVYRPAPPRQAPGIAGIRENVNISRLADRVSAVGDIKASAVINDDTLKLIRSFVDDCKDAPPEKKKNIIDIITKAQQPPPSRFVIGNNVVIADFYVPYMCCSDCSPVAYVFPSKETPEPEKPVIKMETKFCDNDTSPSPIAVSQPGGTFGDAAGNKIKGLDETKLTFTPSVAGAGTYTVIYTVDKIASDPVTVTVLKTPASSDFKFKAEQTPEKLVFQVKFVPNTQDAAFTYEWRFGPGFSPQTSTDQSPTIKATLDPTGGQIKTFATLVVSNGNCGAAEIKKEMLISPNGVFGSDNTPKGVNENPDRSDDKPGSDQMKPGRKK